MPTQSDMGEVKANATGAAARERIRKTALAAASGDAKSLWDALRLAAAKGQDRSVADDLIARAKERVAMVVRSLDQIKVEP